MSTVKRPDKRTERSRQTRDKVVAAARELFLDQGYATTNLQDVAARAGVAVQTIYFVFGNKRTLFKAVVDDTIAGDSAPVATMDRRWFRSAVATQTADEQLRAHVRGTRKILDRVAPMMAVIAAASDADPDIAADWNHAEDPRYTVQRAAAASLVGKPDARPGVSATRAADLLYGLLSPELYLVFVRERGWTPAAFERWAYATLRGQLCADPAAADGAD
ncbi:TetR/AcrR family transcriptional regulator [Actinocatenispora rupis]|uniref:TetR family transcriptional regulator n=1 Tax=Actinocatenispora rupis TaxID=519421 RepID=A0A8J3NF53_9ACTN|nr:TetR/AcrR family transcriptional regulator [Actinocatenispora rupis]GID14555.1 TetR family transcriptional regulator [Actinocatenispora rupis]